MSNTAREELKQAQVVCRAAEGARDAARQATGKARASLAEVIRQLEAIEADQMRAEREKFDRANERLRQERENARRADARLAARLAERAA
jgi:hypothetical protein